MAGMSPSAQLLCSLRLHGLLLPSSAAAAAAAAEYVHHCVEATKQAFKIRDQFVTDPAYMTKNAQSFLSPAFLKNLPRISTPIKLCLGVKVKGLPIRFGWA